MREEEYRVFRGRVRFVAFVILLGLVGVFARVAHLQISRYEELSALSEQEYLRDLKVAPHRGEILDRHNKPLALTVKTPSVIANPSKIQDPRQAARKLAALLNTDLDTIYRRLASERRFAWLERHITPDVAEKVRALNIEGVSLTTEPRRFYPNRHLAAHVVGFAGTDSQGLAGIERSMDKALEGEAQVIEAIRDGRGRAVLDGTMDPSGRARGKDIRLTIDSQIQHVAESALRRIRRETKAVAAVAIVLDVKSADLLAVAVDPHFNPNKPGLSTADERRNRAITDIFEPGSTMKPLALAAALEAGAVKINDKIFCENGKFQIGGYTIRDTHKLGLLNLSDIISRSSNIGSAKIGKALGKERMAAALRAFGFGQKSDLSFPGESRGLLRDPSKWSSVGLANISFGHGIAVTLLQLASAYRVMAADGIYMPPRLVSHIGGEEQRKNRKSRRVISKSVVQQVLPMMEAVVAEGGTGPRARVPGYRVAGKTGTAQKLDKVSGSYSSEDYIAVFAGFLPADKPEVVIVVAVDEPRTLHSGGMVAAPVFSEIGEASMRYLGLVPSAEILEQPVIAEPVIIEEEPALDAVQAKAGQAPSFIGLSARQATERYVKAALATRLEMSGSGRVIRQEPSAGAPLNNETAIRLVLGRK